VSGEVRMIVRNIRQFKADMARADSVRRKAGETAVKVEGYRLMLLMRKELREGKAGTTTLAPLSNIARYGRRNPQPLAPLARNAVRYSSFKQGRTLKASVGFLGVRSSWSWVRLAEKLQAGFTASVDEPIRPGAGITIREYLGRRGAGIGKRSSLRRFFFLRKATRALKTPARPVIEPFWRAHEREAERNIVANFNRKLAGERI